jgi:hypothetical protein
MKNQPRDGRAVISSARFACTHIHFNARRLPARVYERNECSVCARVYDARSCSKRLLDVEKARACARARNGPSERDIINKYKKKK